jgi:hypothetical protein
MTTEELLSNKDKYIHKGLDNMKCVYTQPGNYLILDISKGSIRAANRFGIIITLTNYLSSSYKIGDILDRKDYEFYDEQHTQSFSVYDKSDDKQQNEHYMALVSKMDLPDKRAVILALLLN